MIDSAREAKVVGAVPTGLVLGDQWRPAASGAACRATAIVVGGKPLERDGSFYPPTVLTNVPEDGQMRHEEIFGPVATVVAFETEAEATTTGHDTEYGLVSYLFTRDLDRALRICDRFETGLIGLNQGVVFDPAAPFGGVKHSGFVREGGRLGIEEFLETKYAPIGTTA